MSQSGRKLLCLHLLLGCSCCVASCRIILITASFAGPSSSCVPSVIGKQTNKQTFCYISVLLKIPQIQREGDELFCCPCLISKITHGPQHQELRSKLAQSRCHLEDRSAFSRNLPQFIWRPAFITRLFANFCESCWEARKKVSSTSAAVSPRVPYLGAATISWFTACTKCILIHTSYHQHIL